MYAIRSYYEVLPVLLQFFFSIYTSRDIPYGLDGAISLTFVIIERGGHEP